MVVRNRNQRRPTSRGRLEKQLQDPVLISWVQVPSGLVGQQQIGLGQQRPADRHPLPLPLREQIGIAIELVGNAHLPGQLAGALADRLGQTER